MRRNKNARPFVVRTIAIALVVGPMMLAFGDAGPEVEVQLRLWGTREGGASEIFGHAGATGASGSGGTLNVMVGQFDRNGRPEGRLCMHGTNTAAREPNLGSAPYHWSVDFEIVEARTDRIVLDLAWSRHDSASEGTARKVLGEERRVTLRENDVLVLDFLRTDSYGAPSGCPGSVMVDLTACIDDPKELAHERVGYDLWLVAEAPDGERTAQHVRGAATPGGLEILAVPPLRIPLPGEPEMHAVGLLEGNLRARVMHDGTVDIAIDPTLKWGVAPPGEMPSGYGWNPAGLTLENVHVRESIKVILPEPGGNGTWEARGLLGFASDSMIDAPIDEGTGVARSGKSARVDFNRFFKGYELSLVVRPRVGA